MKDATELYDRLVLRGLVRTDRTGELREDIAAFLAARDARRSEMEAALLEALDRAGNLYDVYPSRDVPTDQPMRRWLKTLAAAYRSLRAKLAEADAMVLKVCAQRDTAESALEHWQGVHREMCAQLWKLVPEHPGGVRVDDVLRAALSSAQKQIEAARATIKTAANLLGPDRPMCPKDMPESQRYEFILETARELLTDLLASLASAGEPAGGWAAAGCTCLGFTGKHYANTCPFKSGEPATGKPCVKCGQGPSRHDLVCRLPPPRSRASSRRRQNERS